MTVKKMIMQAFNQYGRLTDYDLEQICGIDGNSIRPARQELEKQGLIRRTGNRITHPGKENGYREYEIAKAIETATIRMPLNMSKFLELVMQLRAGECRIQLQDGVANIDGGIQIKSISPLQPIIEADDDYEIRPKPSNQTRFQAPKKAESKLEQTELFHYQVLRPGCKKPFVTAKNYRARAAIGIHSKGDIKNFDLVDLPGMSDETREDLCALGIDTLGKLLATSVLGLKNKIVGKDGRVNENFLNGLVDNIRSALDPLGLKFSRLHPHNENPDGSPKQQAS